MKNNKTVYKLIVEDLQSVAVDTIVRKLTDNEIKQIEEKLGDFVNWYDAIQNTMIHLNIR